MKKTKDGRFCIISVNVVIFNASSNFRNKFQQKMINLAEKI